MRMRNTGKIAGNESSVFYPAPFPFTAVQFRTGIFHPGKDEFKSALLNDRSSGLLTVFPERMIQVST